MPNETEVMLVDWFEYNCVSQCDNLCDKLTAVAIVTDCTCQCGERDR